MEILELVKNYHDKLLELAANFRFDKKSRLDLYRITLYGSLIELSGCIILLIENDGYAGVTPLFRAFFEAAVELQNIEKDSNYTEYMDLKFEKEWLKVLKESKSGNPFFSSLPTLPDFENLILEHQKHINKLEAKGIKELLVKEKFERAGMVKEYRSFYRMISWHSHSNLNALVSRHLEVSESDFSVGYYKEMPVESHLMTLDSVAGLLLNAARYMHDCFNPKNADQIKRFQEDLMSVRKKYDFRPSSVENPSTLGSE